MKRSTAGAALIFMLCVSLAAAAFRDPGFFARPAGMGGAFVAVADDASAVWYNPAGLARRQPSVMFSYARPYMGLDGVDMNMSFAAWQFPVASRSSLAIAWSRFCTKDVYQENTFMAACGYDPGPFAAGVTVKYLSTSYQTDIRAADDDVFAKAHGKGAVAFDAGLFKAWNDTFSAGVCAKNINQPDIGLASKDTVPQELSAGMAKIFRLEGIGGILPVTVAASWRDNNITPQAGAELWLRNHTVAFRGGSNSNEASVGASFTCAAGSLFTIDTHYSYTFPFRITGSSGSHRLTLGLRY